MPVFAEEWPHTKNQKVRDLLYDAQLASLKDALGIFNKAIKIQPNCADIFGMRSVAFEANGYYAEALKDANKAIELEPEDSWYFILRARILYHLGRYEDSMKDLKKVYKSPIRRNNEHKRIEGACLYHLGRYQEALDVLTYNAHFSYGGAKSLEAYYYIGLCQLALDQPEKALKAFNEAIEPKRARRDYYIGRAMAYDKLGKKRLAARDRKLASKTPKTSWGSF